MDGHGMGACSVSLFLLGPGRRYVLCCGKAGKDIVKISTAYDSTSISAHGYEMA